MKLRLSLISLSLLLLGCSNTPESSVENMYEGLKDGNFLKFAKYTNDPVTRIFSVKALSTCSVDKTSYADSDFSLLDDCFIEKYSDLELRNIFIKPISENRAKAKVIVKENSQEKTYEFVVVKSDKGWRVTYMKK